MPRWRGNMKKRVLPALFFAGLLVLAGRTCAAESASAEIEIALGSDYGAVESLRAELVRPGEPEPVGYMSVAAAGMARSVGPWLLSAVDAGDYELLFEIRMAGAVHRLRRKIELRDRAQIRVDLARDVSGFLGSR